MSRTVEIERSGSEKVARFVKKNWPIAVGIVGAAGVVGAAVWLTTKYLREKRNGDARYNQALKQIGEEVTSVMNEPAALLESGAYLGRVAGAEGAKAVEELAEGTETEECKDALMVLKDVMALSEKE